jgi:hypothetical protein
MVGYRRAPPFGIFWPAFAVGVGLLGVLVWTLFLGWLLGQAVLAIF